MVANSVRMNTKEFVEPTLRHAETIRNMILWSVLVLHIEQRMIVELSWIRVALVMGKSIFGTLLGRPDACFASANNDTAHQSRDVTRRPIKRTNARLLKPLMASTRRTPSAKILNKWYVSNCSTSPTISASIVTSGTIFTRQTPELALRKKSGTRWRAEDTSTIARRS